MKSVGIVEASDSGTNREMWTSSVPRIRFAVTWIGGGLSLVTSAASCPDEEDEEDEEDADEFEVDPEEEEEETAAAIRALRTKLEGAVGVKDVGQVNRQLGHFQDPGFKNR
jgi:hypothetical protein